jgi:hypothetical protein
VKNSEGGSMFVTDVEELWSKDVFLKIMDDWIEGRMIVSMDEIYFEKMSWDGPGRRTWSKIRSLPITDDIEFEVEKTSLFKKQVSLTSTSKMEFRPIQIPCEKVIEEMSSALKVNRSMSRYSKMGSFYEYFSSA